MSLPAVRQALEVALFAMTPTVPIAFENQSYTPVVGTPWIRAVLMPATPDNPTMGDSFHRLQGLLYLEFNYPKNTGSQAATTRAEATKVVFKRGNSFTNSGIVARISNTPEIGQGSVVGDWYILPWRARWYADIFS